MAGTVISNQLPPNIDITKAPLAYGQRALPKLNRELNGTDVLTKHRALMSLCDILHDPQNISEALNVGIVLSLKKLLTSDDSTIRHKTTEVLFIIASNASGRNAFLEYEIILPLSKLFNDTIYESRKNSHLAIEMLSHHISGQQGIVEAGLIPVLVALLFEETDDIKGIILDTLHYCMRVNTSDALNNNGMNVFVRLLSHSSPVIRGKAARDIMDLSFPLDGKNKAVEVGAIKSLVPLLHDSDADVRAKTAGAIMVITITTPGKYSAIEEDILPSLVLLLSDNSSEVRLNVLKALTTLAEAPKGREILVENVEKVTKLINDYDSPAVRKAAQIAVKVITWKP
ncbi:radial spoke head 14 homolog [Xenia sp. Carnegie-2017]|uniref:radial spoke head 14 homolog n=1 Tax=Xenia sp. Carnegie-2017 TaxID=2897299 RepID=UPI001F03B2E6|nr:radial spoke head 14 homolog [Xenia sp. Carnegie-2017]XP_046860021.1 radial spoke head 14 homolog [Xenia sp. Carnegie-2017]